MTANNQMFEVLGRVMLLATVLVGVSLFVAPQPVEAQPSCLDCYGGGGQPGAEPYVDCLEGFPEGATACRSGGARYFSHIQNRWITTHWCELLGSECQALMMLDIAQDGTVELARGSADAGRGDGPHSAEPQRTCDGVLVRGYGRVAHRGLPSRIQPGGTLALAL